MSCVLAEGSTTVSISSRNGLLRRLRDGQAVGRGDIAFGGQRLAVERQRRER